LLLAYDYYKTEEDFANDSVYSESELKDAMSHPIQLHYATSVKPWKNPDCTKSEEWFKILAQTPFLPIYLKSPVLIMQQIKEMATKRQKKYSILI
jgi:lipopolysaccharide biosynthesis glycosyltransferase